MSSNRHFSLFSVSLILLSIVALSNTSVNALADESSSDSLADAGLSLIALRNDTLDTNQDGDNDAIRVVVVFNTEQENTNLELRLIGEYKDREVTEILQFTFSEQSNASLVYDAWASGEHELRMQIVDQDGNIITTIPLPTYVLKPALQTPSITLALNAPQHIETGDECTISRVFSDETGPRYGASGVRTFSGAPFTVLDSQDSLDCSNWPAGDYQLKEAYRNDLGQTTEDWLNLTIHNRPAPDFSLLVSGDGNTTDTDCLITMIPTDADIDFSNFQKIWRIQGDQVAGNVGDQFDCTTLSAGVHLVSLEVINNELISAIEGVNLVRLPGDELTEEQKSVAPSRSYGDDTETESVGWISIGVLGLVVVILSYLVLVRVKDSDEELPMRDLGPTPMILSDGSPDAEGLPTTTDDDGVLWRQHPDGNHDWWDAELRVWVRW
ncbi:MAG TPA: hypothetical protein HA354_05075 [Candidatus Poseidoniaceae archaeon]|nr:hypothetical protein [Euryarchaeota archaeon]DAC57628.1 MAG TPA: hypothetical protein D7I07_05055 [Candidatus Poseidoniales archaeon]HII37849.1 hypothetical protein [Candidatus Poseidoniaceae archaeon]